MASEPGAVSIFRPIHLLMLMKLNALVFHYPKFIPWTCLIRAKAIFIFIWYSSVSVCVCLGRSESTDAVSVNASICVFVSVCVRVCAD